MNDDQEITEYETSTGSEVYVLNTVDYSGTLENIQNLLFLLILVSIAGILSISFFLGIRK